MCGIVGAAGALQYKDEALMKSLLLLDYFRGQDSTGLAAIRKSGEAVTAKMACNPLELFELPKFKSALAYNTSKVFLGHNRAATRGIVNTANAHPFTYDHITGVHNGTLTTKSTKDLEDLLGMTMGVDSKALYAAIAQFGIEATIEAIEEGSTSSDGAWSLVWYDQNEDTLNFLRNKHRPMWYSYSKDFKRMYWASEYQMIGYSAALAKEELWVNENGHMFFATDENVHYKYELSKLSAGSTERPKPLAKTLKGKEPAPVTYSGGGYAPFRDSQQGSTTPTTPRSGTSSTTTSSTNKNVLSLPRNPRTAPRDTVYLVGSDNDPYAGFINREKFEAMAKDGCCYCGSTIEWGDSGVTVYEKDDIVMCPTCSRRDFEGLRVYTDEQTINNLQ